MTMTPFEHLTNGDVDYFKEVDLDVLQNSRDEHNDTLFSKAAILNKLECCREIYRRCPSLMWHQNAFLNTALHHSLWYAASTEFIAFLIECPRKTESEGDLERGKKWFAIQNYEGDTALHYAAMKRNVQATRIIMDADRDHAVLRIANFKKNTPLHLAVRFQNLELVKLLAVAGSDFQYSPNNDGETPLLMAMREAQSGDNNTAVQIRKLLLKMQPNESKTRVGTKGWTALHHAAHNGDVSAVEDIICSCPDCVDMLDIKGQNFLHIAVKYEQIDVVKHALNRKAIPDNVLNGQDHSGNTPLHCAAKIGNRGIIMAFLYDSRVNKMTVNSNGQKVLDAVNFDYDKTKAGVYGAVANMDPKATGELNKFDVLVCALIAALSFAAGITVPMGFVDDGTNKGMMMFSKKTSFEAFVISNTFTLLLALYGIFSHFSTRVIQKEITHQHNVETFCTLCALLAMVVAFVTGSYAVLSISDGLAINIFAMCSCFLVFALHPMLKMVL